MAHTPGKWSVDSDLDFYAMPNKHMYLRIYSKDPGPEYAFTVGFVRDADERQRTANALLIAAAPELLAALEGITSSMDALMDAIASSNIQAGDDDFYALTQARAAIRRARGVSEEDDQERARR